MAVPESQDAKFTNSTRAEFIQGVEAGVRGIIADSCDVTLVCKDGRKVEAHRELLGLWSPTVRAALHTSTSLLLLPDFSQHSVTSVLHLLAMGHQGRDATITREEVDILTCLAINFTTIEETKSIKVQNIKEQNIEKSKPTNEPKYTCDLCDERVKNIREHMESDHDDMVGGLTAKEMSSFFRPIPKQDVPEISKNQSQSRKLIKKKEPNECKKPVRVSKPKEIAKPEKASPDFSEFKDLSIVPIINTSKPLSEQAAEKKDLPDAIHTETKTENLLCPKCPKEFDKAKTNPSKWKDMLRCHTGLVHYGKELSNEVGSKYDGNKCKACGKISKDNSNKKKHMLFHHTKYVDLVLKETELAIKNHYDTDKKLNIKVKPLKKLLKPKEVCNNEQFEATDPKRKMEAEKEEINKKVKLDIDETNELADVQDLLQSDNEEEGGKEDNQDDLHQTGGHHKVVADKKEDKEGREKEEGREDEGERKDGEKREEDKEREEKDGREEEERKGGENEEEEKEEKTDEVMSIQDQLLKMQEFSSDEDDDEEEDRLQEFEGEDPEEDKEDGVGETATMETEEGGEDSGDKLEDILNFPLDESENAYEGEDESEEMEEISDDEDTETEDVNLPENISDKIDQLLGNIL